MRQVTQTFLLELLDKARQSERGRVNYNLHEPHETVQRMFNAMLPGSYVTPHKHENPDKVEVLCPLLGKLAAYRFDETGGVLDAFVLDAEGDVRVVDIPPRTYHTFFALTPAVVLEIIQGPYDAATHKKFAPWAPFEGSEGAAHYMAELLARLPL
jgi:cupin fold WbuC family metalloprotein